MFPCLGIPICDEHWVARFMSIIIESLPFVLEQACPFRARLDGVTARRPLLAQNVYKKGTACLCDDAVSF